MSTQAEVDAVFSLIKERLKKLELSYSHVARRLKMSESNVKRIFSARTCSINQLAEICEAAETSLLDLMSIAAKRRAKKFLLPASSESFFLANFDCFIFYRNLFGSDDPAAFVNASKISSDKLRHYLKELEKLKLIIREGKMIKVAGGGNLDLSECPKLNRRIKEKWVPWFMGRVVSNHDAPNYYLKIASTGLSNASRAQFINEIENLVLKYQDTGFQEQMIGSGKFESMGICIGLGPHRVAFFEDSQNDVVQLRRY